MGKNHETDHAKVGSEALQAGAKVGNAVEQQGIADAWGKGAVDAGKKALNAGADGVIGATGSGNGAAAEVASDSMKRAIEDAGKIITGDKGSNLADMIEQLKKYHAPVTPEDQKQAQGKLDSRISGLVSESDKAKLSSLHEAMVKGDGTALAAALKGMSDDPKRMQAFVDELNKNLDANNAGAHVVMRDGKALVYRDGANAGVEIDPKTGEQKVRRINDKDGLLSVENGEVINKKPKDVMQDVGDYATNGINGGRFSIPRFEEPSIKPGRPFEPFPIEPKPIEPRLPFEPHWPFEPLQPGPKERPDKPWGIRPSEEFLKKLKGIQANETGKPWADEVPYYQK